MTDQLDQDYVISDYVRFENGDPRDADPFAGYMDDVRSVGGKILYEDVSPNWAMEFGYEVNLAQLAELEKRGWDVHQILIDHLRYDLGLRPGTPEWEEKEGHLLSRMGDD